MSILERDSCHYRNPPDRTPAVRVGRSYSFEGPQEESIDSHRVPVPSPSSALRRKTGELPSLQDEQMQGMVIHICFYDSIYDAVIKLTLLNLRWSIVRRRA